MAAYSGPEAVGIEPDPAQILRQLSFWFEGCLGGEIDLGWYDPESGQLNRFRRFDLADLDACATFAAETNAVAGQSMYFRPALVKPDTPRHVRDEHFLAAPGPWADLDAEGAAERAPTLYAQCPPNMVVVTGRFPHTRVQLYWRREDLVHDGAVLRDWGRRIAMRLGGDTKVTNPTSLMRLGGTIAWPWKLGRQPERTELHLFDDARPRSYSVGAVEHAFPPIVIEGGAASAAPVNARPTSQASSSPASSSLASSGFALTTLNIGSGTVPVEACMAAIRRGDHWHNNMVRLTGHWIARGWLDAEILAASESLTLQGYGIEDTRRDVMRMIGGGRRKWGMPNPAHAIDEQPIIAPLTPRWVESLNLAMLPRRRWLMGRSLLRGSVTLRVSPGGAGKSTLAIEEAVAVVIARDLIGLPVHESCRAWIYNNEDDAQELARRLGAVLQHWSIPFDDVRGRLALNSGADRPLLVAKADAAGNVIRQPDVDGCIAHVRADNIGLLVVDPFVETHEVNENSNEQIRLVVAMFREIAQKGSCAVLLVHHTAKPPQGASDGHVGNMNTARGASALPNAARIVQTLFAMSPQDAVQLAVPEEQRHRYVRLDDAKANHGLIDGRARWFKRVGVVIANGDEVGVLVPEDLDGAAAARTRDDPTLDAGVLDAIGQAWRGGTPLTDQPRARARFAPAIIAQSLGASTMAVEAALARLMSAGKIRKEVFDRKRHLSGLRVVPLDERSADISIAAGPDDE